MSARVDGRKVTFGTSCRCERVNTVHSQSKSKTEFNLRYKNFNKKIKDSTKNLALNSVNFLFKNQHHSYYQ